MRIVQVVASIDDPSAGPSTSVTRLAGELGAGGQDVIVRSVAGWRDAGRTDRSIGEGVPYEVCRSPLEQGALARLICSSSHLRSALLDDAGRGSVLHAHGLWLMPNVYPGWAIKRKREAAAFIVSPRGMLGGAALAFSRTSKRAFWLLLQRGALAKAAALHATSEAEVDDIRAFGLTLPVAMIPNGVDVPPEDLNGGQRAGEVLYLGRLHPKKGIDILIRAWAQISKRCPDWSLRIVGPSEVGYVDALRACVRDVSAPRVTIEGPAFGVARANCYARAGVFVLPTRNENFAMVVAEALAAGVPVIATKGAPWAGLESEGCGWWVDHGVEAIAVALERATAQSPERLAEMGARGRAWMRRDFSWPRMAKEMLSVYEWARHGGSPPHCMRFA